MNIKKITLISLLLAGLSLGLFNNVNVSAQEIALPLIVAPSRQELTLNPGEKATVTLRFYNQQEAPVAGTLKVSDFIVDDREGTPNIIENTSDASPRFSASTWFTLPFDRMSIAPNDKVSVQANISVPEQAHPGGRYVAIYFEPSGSLAIPKPGFEGAGSMKISTRLAGLVYIRVAGPIKEQAFITRLFSKSFYEYGPISVFSEIFNQGDYHIKPNGAITLTNMLGGATAQEKLTRVNIFPDAMRSFDNTIGKKWMFGRYKIDFTATYGEKGQVLNKSIYVWLFPWRVVLMSMLAVILLLILGFGIYKKVIVKEAVLESQLEKEKEEIEKLKEELKKKDE